MSSAINLYFVCCCIFSSDIRQLQNYPIFFLTLLDCIITGPGALSFLISEETDMSVLYNEGYRASASSFFGGYSALRKFLKYNVGPVLRNKVSPFLYKCLPSMFMVQLNHYSTGPCNFVLAYERSCNQLVHCICEKSKMNNF